jgi:hypothetical protein
MIPDAEWGIEYECPVCGHAGMSEVPEYLCPPAEVDYYTEAQKAIVDRGLLNPEEAGLVQAQAMLAIVDAIRELTISMEGR